MSVAFRIRCCLCAKNIPLAGDVIALDGEWQRRYPDMYGTLACERCVIDRGWNCCTTSEGSFVDGHIAAPDDQVDVASWSHHIERGGFVHDFRQRMYTASRGTRRPAKSMFTRTGGTCRRSAAAR